MNLKLEDLSTFKGKRNAVLTFFFAPQDNFRKRMNEINRQVSQIKHDNKRKQILGVLSNLREMNLERHEIGGNGLILGGAHDHLGRPYYFELVPPNPVSNFEYYYGYTFNVNRIQEILCADVIQTLDTKVVGDHVIKQLITDLKENIDNRNIVISQKEINKALEEKLVKKIYDSTNKEFKLDFVDKVRQSNGEIVKVLNTEIMKPYDNQMAQLWYPITYDLLE